MDLGYRKPLYILPFDHRASYIKDLFALKAPLDATQRQQVIDSKQVIYAGFTRALDQGLPKEAAGLLVDEEFGADILRDASSRGVVVCVPTEHSGSDEFQFEYGDEFAQHLDAFNPTFAKALVRFNTGDDAQMNQRQSKRLRQLSDYCRSAKRHFMFELLVPATKAQLAQVQGDKDKYDSELRPELVLEAIETLQEAGVEPDVWKIEGLDQRDDCARVVTMARRQGRDGVGCIVLGRGADETKVTQWLRTAAGVPGFIGFAVGRTSFFDAVKDFEEKRLTKVEAAEHIARRFQEWAAIFENPGSN